MGSHAVGGENFKQQGVFLSAVDHVDLVDAGVKRGNAAGNLGEHSAGKNAVLNEFINVCGADGCNDAVFVAAVGKDVRL